MIMEMAKEEDMAISMTIITGKRSTATRTTESGGTIPTPIMFNREGTDDEDARKR
jgi:hypothetical protein